MKLRFRKEIMSNEFTKHHIDGMVDEDGNPIDVVFHHFKGIDKGNPHDHPYSFQSTIVHGWYTERVYHTLTGGFYDITRKKGDSFFIKSNHIHKIIDMSPKGCYTMIFPEKKEKEPGFYRFEDEKVFYRQWNETEFKPYKI